ncbi:hypothetical protein HNQ77_003850 [Silvibacterium bohemicum]|uniref:Uncharacterized protein n=1 Tax=Silvibacterium bohemicum TaxID=1577686 RepID=A0A841JXK0_9BACT|nr:hypothetical protein [Silvibacterium bohemicum]MBB6145880.1 hypothetical protein [Silvibacterium bohemicum]
MATLVTSWRKIRADDIFFPVMALLILAVVVIGFAQSYFLPGMVLAKLPNRLVHIHGALFVGWIFLLLMQTSLVAARKVKLHMTLGMLGVILLPLMVTFGVLTLFDSIRRNGTGIPAELILVGDLEELAIFAGLTVWALLARRKAASHKRLMILGTMAIMGPAINRWPFPPDLRMPGTIGVYAVLPLLVIAYDLWSLRRIHRDTAIASAIIIVAMLTMLPVASMGFWQQIVAWIRHP